MASDTNLTLINGTRRVSPGSLSTEPVWLEPFTRRPSPSYDRRKDERRFWQWVPAREEERIDEKLHQLLTQLGGLSEPASFEVFGSAEFLECQFVVQRRDARLLTSAASAAFQQGYLTRQEADPLWLHYDAMKREGLSREYHFLDYHTRPPCYLPVFHPETGVGGNLLAHLSAIFRQLDDGELGFYQLLFMPCRRAWGEVWRRDLHRAILFDPELRAHRLQVERRCRASSIFFAVALRVGGFLKPSRSRPLMRSLHASVRGLTVDSGRLAHLTRSDYYDESVPRRDHFYLLFNRVAFHPGMVLTANELAALFPAFTASALESAPGLTVAEKSCLAPEAPAGSGQVLGLNRCRGRVQAVRVGPHLPNEHIYFVGKSGYAKTTAMAALAGENLKCGQGLAVVDPHGDLVQRLLSQIPEKLLSRTLYLDPADPDYVIPFNVLAHSGNPIEKEHLRADLLDFFEELLGDRLGVSIEHVLNHCLLTLLSRPDSTLADLESLLVDSAFREELVQSLSEPKLVRFWRQEFPAWLKAGGRMTITNKLSPLLLPGAVLAPLLSRRENRSVSKNIRYRRLLFGRFEVIHGHRLAAQANEKKTGDWASRALLSVFPSTSSSPILKRMMDLEQFKKFLGPAARAYRPQQLPQLRKEMYEVAELLLDIYLTAHGKSNKHRPASNPKNPVDN